MITKQEAMTADMFYHISRRNKDGTALRARRNGKTQTWVRRPNDFSIPVKHGLKRCFRIDDSSRCDWLTFDITEVDAVPVVEGFVSREELTKWCDAMLKDTTSIRPFSDWCEEIGWQAMAMWLRKHTYVFHSSIKETYLSKVRGNK